MKFILLLALLPAVVLSAPPHKFSGHKKASTEEATLTQTPAPAVEAVADESTPTEAAPPAEESSSDATPESAAAPEYEPVVTDASETPAAVTEAAEAETPAPTVSEEPETPVETSETSAPSTEASEEPQDETSDAEASTDAPAEPAAETETATSDADSSSSSSSESDESTHRTPTPASSSSESSEETTPAAAGEAQTEVDAVEKVQPVQQLQQPVVAKFIPTGAEATIDGVTVQFALQATWMVEGQKHRGYIVKIFNKSKKAVCGVTFINNVESTDIWNMAVADDGSLSTQHLHLAPGATAKQFGYVSAARSKPTILAVTYC